MLRAGDRSTVMTGMDTRIAARTGGHDGGEKMILLCVAAMRLPLQEERMMTVKEHHETA